MHIHVLYEYGVDHKPHGSAYIRLLKPLEHPTAINQIKLTVGETYEKADVVIVDRTWKYSVSFHEVEQLIAQIRKDGCCLVYSIDDNLLDLDLSDNFRPAFTLEQLSLIRLLAREADGILVSTPPLAERMKRINPEVHVLPNALDEQLFSKTAPTKDEGSGRLKVGFMGTYTHEADLYMILEAMRKHADKIELQLVGGLSDPNALAGFLPLQTKILDTEGQYEYPDFARWMSRNLHWDIGIAPLEENIFTRSKSDIKFLDYSILGIPGIYSNVEAYKNTVIQNETGLLTDNTTETWTAGFDRMITDPDLRKRLAKNAENWVHKNRTLEVCAINWVNAVKNIVEKSRDRNRLPS